MFDYERTFLVVIIIALPLLSAWVYFDAKKRGVKERNALWWATGALFLSVLVLPAWFWARPNFQNDNEFLCPECNEVYRGKRLACPHCGYMVVDDEIVDMSSIEAEKVEK